MRIFKWPTKGIAIVILLFVGLFIFVLGLEQTFPSRNIAEYFEHQILTRTGIATRISPIELQDLRSLNTDRISILAPPAFPINDLFVLQNLKLILLPDLLQNALTLQGQAYTGKIKASLDYVKRNQIHFFAQDVTLDHIPALHLLPYAQLQGLVSLEGRIVNLDDLQNRRTQIPKGNLTAQLSQVKIKPKNLNTLIPVDITLPDLEFSDILLNLNYDNLLKVEKIMLKGAINGSIDGQIQLNQQNWGSSKVQFHVKVELSHKLQQALGSIGLLIKNFQCGTVIDFDVSGTLRRLRTPKKRACS